MNSAQNHFMYIIDKLTYLGIAIDTNRTFSNLQSACVYGKCMVTDVWLLWQG